MGPRGLNSNQKIETDSWRGPKATTNLNNFWTGTSTFTVLPSEDARGTSSGSGSGSGSTEPPKAPSTVPIPERRSDYKRPDSWLPDDWARIPPKQKEMLYKEWKEKHPEQAQKAYDAVQEYQKAQEERQFLYHWC